MIGEARDKALQALINLFESQGLSLERDSGLEDAEEFVDNIIEASLEEDKINIVFSVGLIPVDVETKEKFQNRSSL